MIYANSNCSRSIEKGIYIMSRFKKISHVIWHCQYHIIWVPKYRYRILNGKIKEELKKCFYVCAEKSGCIISELSIQDDHIHMIVIIPPKQSVSQIMGIQKGRSAIRIFSKFPELKKKGLIREMCKK